ncbi:MAG: pyridoxal phosphate-dependent aminotransferase [Bdellovibrionota bacterium]
MISKRSRSVDSSGIRKVFDLAAKLKDPVNLSIGQPDFDAAPEVKLAAHEAIDGRRNGYTPTQGIAELRDKVRSKYGFDDASGISTFITSGVSGGLFLSYMALLDPGDEILIPDPFFCMYRDLALLINAVPRYYDIYPHFSLNVEAIEREITPRTKAIIVSSPGNPTGYSLTQDELNQLTDLAERKGIWLIYDEIYELFNYDAPHAQCFGKYERTIILNGFSKSHGIPGWRIGYAIGPNEVIQEMMKLQQYTFVCAPSIAQWGMLAGMHNDFSEHLTAYRAKRDFMYSALKDSFELVKPGGAFYLFPEAPGGSGQRFVERCIAANLLVVPGSVFSRRDTHFRISFSAPMSQLERGADILCSLAKA